MKVTTLITLIYLCFHYSLSGQLFITELADPKDDSNARYIELFNAGNSDIDLSDEKYGLLRYTNDNTVPSSKIHALTGIVESKGFYIIAKDEETFTNAFGFAPDQEIATSTGPPNSNGDDKILLLKGEENTIVDMYGVVGELGADYCHGYTDGRAERSSTTTFGNNSAWSCENWIVYGSNTPTETCNNHITKTVNLIDNLYDPRAWIGYNTYLNFELSNSEITEDGVLIEVCVEIQNPDLNNATSVEIEAGLGTATSDADFSITSPIALSFPAQSAYKQCFGVLIADDDEVELAETIILHLLNPQGGVDAKLGTNSTHTIQIIDNDVSTLEAGSLIITEIMYNPSAVVDTNGEWFEVYNTTEQDINLIGLKFMDDNTDDEYFEINQSLVIEASSYFVFARNGDYETNGGIDADFVYGSDISLTNSTDGIKIMKGDNVIDAVVYDTSASFPSASGASIFLNYNAYSSIANDDGSNWSISTTPYGEGDYGSIGSGLATTNVENTSIQMSIYPNPVTNGNLYLQFKDENKRTIEIYNTLGSRVFKKETFSKEETITVDLNPAMYLIKITESNNVVTERILFN